MKSKNYTFSTVSTLFFIASLLLCRVIAVPEQTEENDGLSTPFGSRGSLRSKAQGSSICPIEDQIPCSKNKKETKIFLCHYQEKKDQYETLCLRPSSIDKGHLKKHTKDYCGKCSLSRQFIHTAFVKPEEQEVHGEEEVEALDGAIFQVTYDLEYNDFPFISLAAVKDLITYVECANIDPRHGFITVVFQEDVDPDLVSRMIPIGSLVVVDSSLYGPCDVASVDSGFIETVHDGYLLVEDVEIIPSTNRKVLLRGEVASFHYFYKTKDINYTRLADRRDLLELPLGYAFNFKTGIEKPKDFLLRVKSEISFSGYAFIMTQTEKWNFKNLRSFTVNTTLGYKLDSEISTAVVIQPSPKVEFNKEFTDSTKIFSVYDLPGTKAVKFLLRMFVSKKSSEFMRAGLFVRIHPKIAGELYWNVTYELLGTKLTASTGAKEVTLSISKKNGISAVFSKNEAPSIKLAINDNSPEMGSLSDSVGIDVFAGHVIQMVFDTFQLATGSIGMQAGAYIETEIFSDVQSPVENVPGFPWIYRCNTCHKGKVNLDVGMSDPFLSYTALFGEYGEKKDLPSMQLKYPLLEVCFLLDRDACSAIDDPTLTIEMDNSLSQGGLVDTQYFLTFRAENIDSSVTEVLIQWVPGLGAGGSKTVQVQDGVAEYIIPVQYGAPGQYTFTGTVSSGTSSLATATKQVVIIGPIVSIDPPGLMDAQTNVPYSFTIIATHLPDSPVEFAWSFGDGAGSTGSSSVSPSDGTASTTVTYTYSKDGAFGLVVAVKDAANKEILARANVNVVVGTYVQRNYTLNICETWSVVSSGNQGVMIDTWDISEIPPSSVFDLYYNAYSYPDRFLIEYPYDNLVLDTGWRGSSTYNGASLFPEGVAGQGSGTVTDVFERLSQDEFRLTVVAPMSGTAWDYKVRCRSLP